MNEFSIVLATWLLTYAVHSTLLLCAVWGLERVGLVRALASREWLWKLALVGGLATASVQVVMGLHANGADPASGVSAAPAPIAAPDRAPAQIPSAPPAIDAAQPVLPARVTTDRSRSLTLEQASETQVSGQPGIGIANPPIQRPEALQVPIADFAPWLVLLWFVVASALLLRFAVSSRAASTGLQNRETLRSGRAHNQLRVIALSFGKRRVVLSRADIAGPLCLPNGEICIPEWAESQLDDDQLRGMLAHEFAHSRRLDPQWRVATLLINALLFFQPLNRIAARRLDDLAELACDGAAADIGNGRALATCLAHFARRLVAQPAPAWTAAMARSEAGIVHRVKRLVDGDSEEGSPLTWQAKVGAMGVVLALSVLTPGLALKDAQSASTERHHGSSVEVQEDGGRTEASLTYSEEGYFLHLEMEGRITFNDDESDIIGMEDGDFLKIQEEGEHGDVRLILRGTDDGLERAYRIDGDRRAWDDEAQTHLQRLLPTMFRELGLDMPGRVTRLLDAGGPDRVIDEIGMIRSDYVAASYMALLAKRAELNDGELDRLLRTTEALDSDYELRRALGAVLRTQELNTARINQILDVGRSIDSDFESRTLLAALAPRLVGDNRDGVQSYLDRVDELGSSFEQKQALVTLMKVDGLHRDDLARAIAATQAISSDHEAKSVLHHAAKHLSGDPALYSAYLDAVRHIGSDFEKHAALSQLLKQGEHPEESYRQMLEVAGEIGSDFEQAGAMIEIAAVLPRSTEFTDAYLAISETIGSDYERERAQRAIRDEYRGERRKGRREGRQEGRQQGRSDRRGEGGQ